MSRIHIAYLSMGTALLATACGATVAHERQDAGVSSGTAEVGGASDGSGVTGGEVGGVTGFPGEVGGASQVSNCNPDVVSPSARTLVTLASGQGAPYAIAVDSTSVYWSTYGIFGQNNGTVMKVPLNGGVPITLASGQGAPASIAVDSTSVYWSTSAMMKMPLGGGTPVELATGVSNDPIAVGPLGAYGSGAAGGNFSLVAVPLNGGALTALAPISETYGIAVDATSVYWTNFSDPCPVMKVPLRGGASTTLVSAPGAGFGIALDASDVYFITSDVVMSVPLNGGTATTLVTLGGTGIAVDDCFVYFTTGTPGAGLTPSGTVMKVAKTGGSPVTLATGQDQPGSIAVDATSVYWVNNGSDSGATGSVMRLTPK